VALRPRAKVVPAPPPSAAASPAAPGWLDREAPLGPAAAVAIRRLGRRAAASWPVWVGLALAISAATAVRRLRHPPRYEVTVVLRLAEGGTPGGSQSAGSLATGALRAHVSDLAFSSARLVEVMKRHVSAFPDVVTDPSFAVERLREDIDLGISENDFIEERRPTDPRRSARLAVTFHASDPELAFAVAHDLTDVLVGAELERERRSIARDQAAAAAAQKEATAEMAEAARASAPAAAARLIEGARDRLAAAQRRAATSALEARALAERQAVRFDVVDPGRVPPVDEARISQVTELLLTLLASMLVAALLAGALDPRVIDADDVTALGLSVLGQVPRLPGQLRVRPAAAGRAGGQAGEQVGEDDDARV
jgi:hypothetical protein